MKEKLKAWRWQIFIVLLLVATVLFFVIWFHQQKIANGRMVQLLERATIKESEELTKEETQFLFENYTDKTLMKQFKKERKEILVQQMNLGTELEIQDGVLTYQEATQTDEHYLQLGFLCKFNDNVSDLVCIAYRYYEDEVVKIIIYDYDTIKSRLFSEKRTGMTLYYYGLSKSLNIMEFTLYEWHMANLFKKYDPGY